MRGRLPRLGVSDYASVDSRRRLVLVRRDNVEHLVMIGGPTDVVVEANITKEGPVSRGTDHCGRPRAGGNVGAHTSATGRRSKGVVAAAAGIPAVAAARATERGGRKHSADARRVSGAPAARRSAAARVRTTPLGPGAAGRPAFTAQGSVNAPPPSID